MTEKPVTHKDLTLLWDETEAIAEELEQMSLASGSQSNRFTLKVARERILIYYENVKTEYYKNSSFNQLMLIEEKEN